MGKICEQFEAETPADSEATQKARFEAVLDLMQQVRPAAAVGPGVWGRRWDGRVATCREQATWHVPGSLLAAVSHVPLLPSAAGPGPPPEGAGWGDGECVSWASA